MATSSTATTAGAQHGLQAGDTRFSDPATRQAAAIAVAASSGAGLARTASTGSHGQPGPGLSSSAPEPASRSFLDPLGIVEKVLHFLWQAPAVGNVCSFANSVLGAYLA